jgi:hypothetical protein
MFQGGDAYWIPGAPAVDASGGSAVLHGNITLIPGSGALYGPGPTTIGAVTTGAAPLPYLTVTGIATASGDLAATQPVTVMLEGLIPSAPFALAIDAAPGFTTPNGPLFLGELLVPLPPAVIFEGVLDALGMFQLTTIPAVSVPSAVGVPLYAQFGVLDAPEANVRLSNGQIRRFQ